MANGLLAASAVSTASGADLALRGPIAVGELDMVGGIVRVDTDTTIPAVSVTSPSGSLQGSAVVTTSDLLLSGSGSLAGGGRLVLAAAGAGIVTGGRVLNELRNEGTLTFATGATTQVSGLLTNDGAIELHDDSDLSISSGTVRTRVGATITKVSGLGESTIFPALENDGTVDVQSGTLALAGSLPAAAMHDGAFTISSPAAELALEGNVEMSPSAAITGPVGTLALSSLNSGLLPTGTIRASTNLKDVRCTTSAVDGVSFTVRRS